MLCFAVNSRFVVRASSQPPSSVDAQEKLQELLADAKEKVNYVHFV